MTIRRGSKWYDDPNRDLELCECFPEHNIVGHARVFSKMLLSFSTLTDDMLENEHEISSRTVLGLLESMRRAYGDDFKETERVTVLTYWRIN